MPWMALKLCQCPAVRHCPREMRLRFFFLLSDSFFFSFSHPFMIEPLTLDVRTGKWHLQRAQQCKRCLAIIMLSQTHTIAIECSTTAARLWQCPLRPGTYKRCDRNPAQKAAVLQGRHFGCQQADGDYSSRYLLPSLGPVRVCLSFDQAKSRDL